MAERLIGEPVRRLEEGQVAERLIGELPRPRVLLLLDEDDDEFTAAMEEFVPTLRAVGQLDEVNLDEWDVIITDNRQKWPRKPVHILYFFAEMTERLLAWDFQPAEVGGPSPRCRVVAQTGINSNRFRIPANLDPDVVRLVKDALLPVVHARERKTVLQVYGQTAMVPPRVTALLKTAEGGVLAACVQRAGDDPFEALFIPADAGNRFAWAKYALWRWRALDEEPWHLADWHEDDRWQTKDEARHRRALRALADEQLVFVERFARREHNLRVELDAAESAAAEGPRRLLTHDGDQLVDAVEAALAWFGFGVTNMDVERAARGKDEKLEDLQVRDPDVPDWVAVVEVKGYTGGAKSNDLLQLSKIVRRFRDEHSREPDRQWYIVNQFRKQDPAGRPLPLASQPDELATFTGDNGLIIDTAELFKMVRLVEDGHATVSDARTLVREGIGVLKASVIRGHSSRA